MLAFAQVFIIVKESSKRNAIQKQKPSTKTGQDNLAGSNLVGEEKYQTRITQIIIPQSNRILSLFSLCLQLPNIKTKKEK